RRRFPCRARRDDHRLWHKNRKLAVRAPNPRFAVAMYRSARNFYWRIAKRDLHRLADKERTKLRRFVRPRDLVFDIGANVGDVTSLLMDIGARVVSVEPTPGLRPKLERLHPYAVESSAVGEKEGEAEFAIAADPSHSTLSSDYLAIHAE